MQIKYKITLVYTLIVTVILLMLCSAIYYFSAQDREKHFKERLKAKAIGTAILLKNKEYGLFEKINEITPSGLVQRSIYLYDEAARRSFYYNDLNADSLVVSQSVLDRARRGDYFYKKGGRDVLALQYKNDGINYIVVVASYDENKVEWLNKLRNILLVCLIGSMCIALTSGYIFSLGLVRPISSLTQTITHISTEAISERLNTGNGKDEFQQLAKTINDLLDRLQISFDTQRRFISNASHELSTPLTAITSQLDVALQKERNNDEYKKVISSVKDDMKQLGLLMRSLLEIAKASGSEGGIELTFVRIDELLMGIPSDIRRISPLYDVIITFEEFPDQEFECIVYGNHALLNSAIKNIVHNACKFSKDKTALVKLWFTHEDIIISVADKGPGISMEEIDHIFQPFFRGYRQDNLIHGSGLGLALAKRIISLHKGEIDVETMVGRGSTFYIKLPINKLSKESATETSAA